MDNIFFSDRFSIQSAAQKLRINTVFIYYNLKKRKASLVRVCQNGFTILRDNIHCVTYNDFNILKDTCVKLNCQ